MTAEEFEQLPESDRKFELNHGEIVEVEMALARHEKVKTELTMLLAGALYRSDFVVVPEAMHRLAHDVDRIPDLGIWRRADFRRMDSDRTLVGGPLVAIEVVSSETAEALDEKTRQYFSAGTILVWVIYPKSRSIRVERPSGGDRLSGNDVLQASEIVPGLKIRAAEVFALLDDE